MSSYFSALCGASSNVELIHSVFSVQFPHVIFGRTVHAPKCGQSREVSFNWARTMPEIDCLNRFTSTLLRSAALLTVGAGYLIPFFFFFEKLNNSSQPKNEKSTARKTWPILVEKMAMLEKIHAEVSRYVSVLATVSWSIKPINQSINQSINQTKYYLLKNARNFANSIYLAKTCFDVKHFEVVIAVFMCGE